MSHRAERKMEQEKRFLPIVFRLQLRRSLSLYVTLCIISNSIWMKRLVRSYVIRAASGP